MTLPPVVLLTDRSQLRLGRGLLRTVTECAEAGLRAVIVREHDLPAEARHALIEQLASVDGLTVISSRIPDPAATGVHLAADGAAAGGWWGRSCHDSAAVHRAAAEGAAWVTLSPYAASASKPGYGPPLRAGDYASAAGAGIDVLALGGIAVGNAAQACAAGATGVAVMGSVMRAADPAAEVAALLRVVSG
ncbi:thiamine phosphate synthase [Nocardioides limicola]|uniref:thiamine phosphate synthase n=1 Tax=Nocardioides limicola TaxID=2803368 RepID=UPI00193BBE6A|nr:thiamine phosphate synthase [Nocardioides sp. DJM-14]